MCCREKEWENSIIFKYLIHTFQKIFFKHITKDPYFLSALNVKPFFLAKNNDVMYIFVTNLFVTAVILKPF